MDGNDQFEKWLHGEIPRNKVTDPVAKELIRSRQIRREVSDHLLMMLLAELAVDEVVPKDERDAWFYGYLLLRERIQRGYPLFEE